MAQVLLRELLPRFSAEELMSEFKQAGGGLKSLLEATEMYSGKHYTRADRNLKRTFYVQYVLSQMTLLEDKKQLLQESESTKDDLLGVTAETTAMATMGKAVRKRDKKAKAKKESSTKKKTTNLFTSSPRSSFSV